MVHVLCSPLRHVVRYQSSLMGSSCGVGQNSNSCQHQSRVNALVRGLWLWKSRTMNGIDLVVNVRKGNCTIMELSSEKSTPFPVSTRQLFSPVESGTVLLGAPSLAKSLGSRNPSTVAYRYPKLTRLAPRSGPSWFYVCIT